MEIKLHITKEKFQDLTLEALIALEEFQEGGTNFRGFRDLLAPFLVDGEGNPLPEAQARKAVGQLKIGQLQQVAAEFSMKLKDYAVPKANGRRSSRPSGTAEEAPAGSES